MPKKILILLNVAFFDLAKKEMYNAQRGREVLSDTIL